MKVLHRLRSALLREVLRGERVPRGFGVAWVEYHRDAAVAMPIPLNLVAGAVRAAWLWMKSDAWRAWSNDPALDPLAALEHMARQHCHTLGPVESEPNTTNSLCVSANADALRLLSMHGRFRIVREHGRAVVGYWPEHDPLRALDERIASHPV